MSHATITQRGGSRRQRDGARFARHLVGMAVAMVAGMMVSAAVFLSIVGMTADEALRRHAVLFVVIQTAGMTSAMVGWMRYRGHEWARCNEMAAAMVAPAVALICLRVAGAISGPICGLYCAGSIIAMILVMLYRRREYGGAAAHAPQPG